jgi:hypothetical protein
MIKRNSALALGGILAVAGCAGGGGGSAAVPVAKPAQSGSRPLSTASFTINPTLLRHAASKRRRPAFVDTGGNSSFPAGAAAFLEVSSRSADGLQPPIATIPIAYETTSPISVSIPLYGPDGFIRVKEIFMPDSTVPSVQFALADTQAGPFDDTSVGNSIQYHFQAGGTGGSSPIQFFVSGGASAGALTLNAVAGGVVLSDTPDGSSGNTVFVPANNFNYTTFTPNTGNFIYAFPADAAGGFTSFSVPGGFTKPVVLTPGQTFAPGLSIGAASIPGAFALTNTDCANGGLNPGAMINVSFDATDIFGAVASTLSNDTMIELGFQPSGYLFATNCGV